MKFYTTEEVVDDLIAFEDLESPTVSTMVPNKAFFMLQFSRLTLIIVGEDNTIKKQISVPAKFQRKYSDVFDESVPHPVAAVNAYIAVMKSRIQQEYLEKCGMIPDFEGEPSANFFTAYQFDESKDCFLRAGWFSSEDDAKATLRKIMPEGSVLMLISPFQNDVVEEFVVFIVDEELTSEAETPKNRLH